MTHVKSWSLNMQFGRRDDSPNHTLWCRSHNNPMLWPSTGGVQTIVRWIHLFSLLQVTYLLTLHTTNRPRQSKFTMLLSLNYINETMYYWGVNSKMQTSHTLCSRPKWYGALHSPMTTVRATYGIFWRMVKSVDHESNTGSYVLCNSGVADIF